MGRNNIELNIDKLRLNNYKIYFGKYPQSLVVDNYLINALDKIEEVNDLGYIVLEGNEYLRKTECSTWTSSIQGIGDDNYEFDKTFYFRVEPIEWICTNNDIHWSSEANDAFSEELTLISKKSLMQLIFDDKANVYENSFIRKWLNEDFFNKSFSKSQQEILNTYKVSEDCYDYVYLLSKEELDSIFTESQTGTESTNLTVSCGIPDNERTNWLLRSSAADNKVDFVHHRGGKGTISVDHQCGIVPVITLKPNVFSNIFEE